jgi:ABC-type nitrate/sulfonate/bicarbonate transport system substrate-binding protein
LRQAAAEHQPSRFDQRGLEAGMQLAVPDLVSSSYFPALAATRMPATPGSGAPLELQHIFPAGRAADALRDGTVQFYAGPAHVPLHAFPGWRGAKILMALAQRTYWLLVLRPDIPAGPVGGLADLTICAAPGPDLALRQLFRDAGLDLQGSGVRIVPPPPGPDTGESFGLRAARALSEGVIDGFWANSMAAGVAVRQGVGRVVLDPRRGDGPPSAATYTFPALVTTDAMIDERRVDVRRAVAQVVETQRWLTQDPGRATGVVTGIFPPLEAGLIEDLVRRDVPYYTPGVDELAVSGLSRFAQAAGLLDAPVRYDDMVAAGVRDLWDG